MSVTTENLKMRPKTNTRKYDLVFMMKNLKHGGSKITLYCRTTGQIGEQLKIQNSMCMSPQNEEHVEYSRASHCRNTGRNQME